MPTERECKDMASKEWQKPEVKEVELETDEDVLAQCWSPSVPTPVQGTCGSTGNNEVKFAVPCPDV